MIKKNRTLPNQSLLDMILTEYGTLETGMAVAAANNVDISNIPLMGGLKEMPVVPEESIDLDSTFYLRKNNISIGTLALPSLEYSIVLKPRLHIVPNAAGDPHVLGYYSFDLIEAAGFIHTNPLENTYLSDNKIHYETEERYLTGEPDETSLPVAITPMPLISIPYRPVWSAGYGYMLVWSDIEAPVVTATYRDIEGNEAYSAPLVALDNITMGVVELFMGDIAVEFVSATSASISLRLTRSHPPIFLANFAHHTMEWLEQATMGTPDPLDPLNANKTIITLGAGAHIVGLKTTYYFPSGTPAYPSSAFTMVIQVQ